MIWRLGICLLFMNTQIKCQVAGSTSPGPMNAPSITDVTASSIRVFYTPVDRARIYYVAITSRHTSTVRTVCINSTGEKISGLDSGTIYYVSIKSTGVNGTVAPDSSHAEIHTLPGPPTIITSTPQPNSVFVFFRLKNYARVSQWTVEYVNVGSGTRVSTNTVSGEYYHVWLSGLEASTNYTIRARASQIWGTDVLNDTDFSDWHTFKTASLSVFGRVVLRNAPYDPQHAIPQSAEFSEVQTIIRNAYARKLDFITKINVLEIEDFGGKPLVHYQLEVTDAKLPSTRDFTPNGSHFSDFIINNGDESVGIPSYYKDVSTSSWELYYEINSTRTCNGTIEFFAHVAVENGSTLEIHLMHDGVMPITGHNIAVIYPNDNGVNEVDLPSNIFVGILVQYRVKDCLSSTTVPLYNEYYSATDFIDSFATVGQLKYTTGPVEATLQANKIEYSFSSDGKSVTLNVPALEKAITYEILDTELQSVFAKLGRSDLDGSDRWKITIPGLVDSTEYTFRIRVTFRQHNGETVLVSSELLNFTTNSSQCDGCATNSHCFSYLSNATVTCECNFGYIGDGKSCEKIQDDSSNSSWHENTTSEDNACGIGYFWNGTNCEDIDECGNSTANDCHGNAACTNSNGSYHCACNDGYRGNGRLCNDTDECIDSTMHSCHGDAACSNTEGSYQCTCKVGFTGNGTHCVSVNGTGPMNAPSITDVTASSIRVFFTPVDRARIYYVTITSRHTSAVRAVCIKSTGEQIFGLDSSTIYYVSIKITDVNGTIAPDSPHAEIHTLPGPPTIITSTPQPNSVFVFFRLKNYARVSQWTVEYVNVGSGTKVSTTTVSGEYYHVWLSGLEASTNYTIRARASQIWGTAVLNDTDFSDWHNFKTASLSVFGRVVLRNAPYDPQHAIPQSAEFSEVQTIIRNAYARKLDFITKINVLEIEDFGGKPLVHYQLEVTDAKLPSTREFTPNGSHFSDFIINNGDESVGIPSYYKDVSTPSWELYYEINTTRICNGTIKIFAHAAVENGSTLEIHLMHDGVMPITSDPVAVIHPNDNGVNGVDLSPNIFVGIPVRYRVKDCLSSTTVPLYNAYYSATDVIDAFATVGPLKYTTAPVEATLQASKIEYSFSSDGKSVILNVPALEKAITYEILDTELQSVFAKLGRNDLDGSDRWKITIPGLVDSTEYTIRIRVTFQQHNGETILVSSDLLNFTTNSSQCEGCATNSHCFSYLSNATVTCECNFEYIGDGKSCEKFQDDRFNSSCNENTTSEDNACSIGFFWNGTNCEDIDECGNSTANDCHDNAACTNSNGSYHCACNDGYRGNGRLCNDTDECIDSTMHSCHGDAACSNTEGNYQCTCKVGFTGNGTHCVSVNGTELTCTKSCPTFNVSTCSSYHQQTWLCEMNNWRCKTFKWKKSIERWWNTSGCDSLDGKVKDKWLQLFSCPDYDVAVDCNNPGAVGNDEDAFGCWIPNCSDGSYRDPSQILSIWKTYFLKFQEKMQFYEEATIECERKMASGC